MDTLAGLRVAIWIIVLGAVVLYAFFVPVAGISPREVTEVSFVVAVLAILFGLRTALVQRELTDPAGDPELREARNRARERRGF